MTLLRKFCTINASTKSLGLQSLKNQSNVDALCRNMLNAINGSKYDAGVLLTSDSYMQQLNLKYRHKDSSTDVLSFRYHDISVPGKLPKIIEEDDSYLGDIYISVPFVQRYCLTNTNTDFDHRMKRLLAHGICHLVGYDHKCDASHQRMEMAEDFILSRI